MEMMALWSFLFFVAAAKTTAGYDSVYEGDPYDNSAKERLDLYSRNLMEGGKQEYDKIMQYSSFPSYGSCWTDVVQNLHSSCRQLTARAQEGLAFDFAACLINKSAGNPDIICPGLESAADCAQNQSTNFFNTFVHFFTHCQSICFYLSSELFQRRVEHQVSTLLDASATVRHQLGQSAVLQSELLEHQKAGLVNARDALNSAEEIRMFIGSMSERISSLQNVFLDEFSGFYSVIFYFASAVGCFIFTATQRTQRARLWVFLLLVTTFAFERFFNKTKLGIMAENTNVDILISIMNADAWVVRHIFLALAAATILYCAFTYVDINSLNWILVLDMKKQIEKLSAFLLKNPLVPEEVAGRLKDAAGRLEKAQAGMEPAVNSVVVAVESAKQGRGDRVDGNVRGSSLARLPLDAYSSRPGSSSVSESRSLDDEGDLSELSFINDRDRRSQTPSREFSRTPFRPQMGTPLPPVTEENNGEDLLSTQAAPARASRSRAPSGTPANFGHRLIGSFSRDRNSRAPTPDETHQELKDIRGVLDEVTSGLVGSMESTNGASNGVHSADSDFQ